MHAGGGVAGAQAGPSRKTSGHCGVSWDKTKNKWRVKIKIDGNKKTLGLSQSEEAAARMYDAAARPLGRAVNFRVHATDRTVAEELAARPPRPEHPFHGIRFNNGKWTAQITSGDKPTHLGRHATPELAARAWDAKASQLGRTDLNFPPPAASGGAKRATREGDDTPAATKRARVAQQQPPATAPPPSSPAASGKAREVATQTPGAYAKAMARLAAAEKAVAALQAEMRALRAKLAKKAKASGA